MNKIDNKITVKTTGNFELSDPIANVTYTENESETTETSFVSQMVGLKRLEIVGGEATQEDSPEDFTINPAYGEGGLQAKDNEATIAELVEATPPPAPKRGRPRS